MKHVSRKRHQEMSKINISISPLDVSIILPIVDFQLSPDDFHSLSTYEGTDFTQKPRVGNFWPAAERIKTLDRKSSFNAL